MGSTSLDFRRKHRKLLGSIDRLLRSIYRNSAHLESWPRKSRRRTKQLERALLAIERLEHRAPKTVLGLLTNQMLQARTQEQMEAIAPGVESIRNCMPGLVSDALRNARCRLAAQVRQRRISIK